MSFDVPLTRSELARALGTSRQNLWNQEKRGALPPPVGEPGKRRKFTPAAMMIAADLIEAARA